MDETHHDLSITGDKAGTRALKYHNPSLQRGPHCQVKSSRHVTGVYATNAAGEALPPMYIFDSGATKDENFRVKVEWVEGLPSIKGWFGSPTRIMSHSFYAVRAKGSMDDSLLNDYCERVVIPLFPNIAKTAEFDNKTGRLICGPVILKLDAGPGRIVTDEATITKRDKFREKGLLILMGLPNATSVQQEMDALYGPFKSATYARGEVVVKGKLVARGLARRNGEDCSKVISLNFEDLATIVNGKEGDDISLKPFAKVFTRDQILRSWAKIGFVPFTRECLRNRKVRSELGQHTANKDLEELQVKYNLLVADAETVGFNPGIFDATIPEAKHIERNDNEDEQVRQLVEQKGAFSSSALWNICGTRVGNAGVVIRAQREQLAVEAAKVAAIEQKKDEARMKLLEKARIAFRKHHVNVNSLTDKDWGDILRWVMPEAGVSVVLKNFKKKDVIIAKLQTLNPVWTSFIPPQDDPDEPLPVAL
jgi:hypothetical protein